MNIISASPAHHDAIWNIFHEVITAGDSYAFDPAMPRAEALGFWLAKNNHVYVAMDGDQVAGSYFLKPNQLGPGSHVANAGYMVSGQFRKAGIGAAMCAHSLEEARRLGFTAMQFNMVISTNASAVSLWKKHGFQIVGTLPGVFRHKTLGFVDAYVMHRHL